MLKHCISGVPLRRSLLAAALALPVVLTVFAGGSPVGAVAHHPSSGTVRHHDRADDPLGWNGTGSSVGPATS
ncbi:MULTISPECIES: hypothetical protein [unclassified Streptomyces]|uniref:hypothetical protein n=1 Tax=unclassified Streptomyces TaxID=2593676 RepID=UPI00332CE0CC